jgi:hypothetical protein
MSDETRSPRGWDEVLRRARRERSEHLPLADLIDHRL